MRRIIAGPLRCRDADRIDADMGRPVMIHSFIILKAAYPKKRQHAAATSPRLFQPQRRLYYLSADQGISPHFQR